MTVENSNLTEFVKDIHTTENGKYYFFEDIIIAEINEGITYTFEAAENIIDIANQFYGEQKVLCYITNRVNNYSVSPKDWLKFFKDTTPLKGYAVVSKNENSWLNSILEKMFLNSKVERFTDLYEAYNWAKELNTSIT